VFFRWLSGFFFGTLVCLVQPSSVGTYSFRETVHNRDGKNDDIEVDIIPGIHTVYLSRYG
jgi:hypothetical protein